MSETTDTLDAIEAGRQTTTPHLLEPGHIYAIATRDGVEQIDLTGDPHRPRPARIAQTVRLTHVDSLIAYWDKHADNSSDVYADRDKRTITAVLDAHHATIDSERHSGTDEEFRPRWQTHRAVVALTLSDPIQAWLAHNGKYLAQVPFAEFLEEHLPYIVQPDAADLLEVAQSFQATTAATFKSGYKLVNGQRQLEYTEHIDATASVRGDSIAVPTHMLLRLPIWRGASTVEEVTARIRYRINHGGAGQLGIGYALDRITDVIDGAFESEVDMVEQHIGRPVLRGTAP